MDQIMTDKDLTWLRFQNEFNDFVANGYKILNDRQKTSAAKDYINELKELAKLRDDGVITQEEFEKKKEEILNRR